MTKKPKTEAAPTVPLPKMWPLSKIVPYPHNPRTHPPAQVKLLADLLAKFGPDQAIVVDEYGVILKGHGRRLGAEAAGLKRFPVVQRRGLSEADKAALRIADNQVALLAGWDTELVRYEMQTLKRADYDLSLIGFGDIELVQFTTLPGPGGNENDRQPGIGNLADRFGIAPFTTLNAREGWWQDRKRVWLSIGIQSELGRGENLLKFSDTINEPDPAKRAARKARKAETA